MKIALLTEKYTPDIGGLAISAERLARILSSAGHEVRVFSPTSNLPPSEQRTLPSNGLRLRVTRFGASKRTDDTLVDWFDLIVEEHAHTPFDILHAYFLTQAGFITTLAGRYLNIPSVVSIRGNDVDRAAFDPARFSHTMFALQHATAVTANAKESIHKARAFVEREIAYIANSVDVGHFKPVKRNDSLAEMLEIGERKLIGFVGEMREKKGLSNILIGYAQVNKKEPTTLLIVGEVRQGDDKKLLDEFQATHRDAHVIVTGYISPADLPMYYSLIDVFVHPSIHDGMPNAVLEAMACGKAIIATSVGGISELIKDGETGLIVPAKEAGALAEAVNRLLADEALRLRLGSAAREFVQNNFPAVNELNANLAVYKQVLNR